MKKKETNSGYAPPIVLYVIGLLFLAVVIAGFIRFINIRSWPEVTATILKTTTIYVKDEDEGNYYSLEVMYSYTVNETKYTSTKLSFDKTAIKCTDLKSC